MKNLQISREEALQIIADDEQIDKGVDLFPLTEEQKKAVKQAKNVSTKKEGLSGVKNLQITNDEREFTFEAKGIKYKVVLSCPRN